MLKYCHLSLNFSTDFYLRSSYYKEATKIKGFCWFPLYHRYLFNRPLCITIHTTDFKFIIGKINKQIFCQRQLIFHTRKKYFMKKLISNIHKMSFTFGHPAKTIFNKSKYFQSKSVSRLTSDTALCFQYLQI